MLVGRFNLNMARSFVGRHVNLHLRDGSVLVNVMIARARREVDNGKPTILCIGRSSSPPQKILLREIEWVERLNPYLLETNA